MNANSEFCFCTLALGAKYRSFTQQLAQDLENFCPGTLLLVFTDKPEDFGENKNIVAYRYYQQGILFCYHDRRLVIAKALSKFPLAIHIDADTRVKQPINDVRFFPGIIGRKENLIEHLERHSPERIPAIKKVAYKLEIPLESVSYVGESLFVVGTDSGKEEEFVKYWGLIGRYLELQGIHGGDGNAIGLAAKKVEWEIDSNTWINLRASTSHLDAAFKPSPETWWQKYQRKLGYHYRLNAARLSALQNFDFYYR